jgi:signal transduction histidine kinase
MTKDLIIIVLAGCLFAQVWVSHVRKERADRELKEIIDYLCKVQDCLALPEWKHFQEGQFSILQSEIYKVVVLLQQAYSQEAAQKRYMADMLSDISHQIKTPISAITILADLLESSELSEEERLEYAGRIEKQAKRITWLIRNLLTLAQLEADVLEFKKEMVPVKDILQSIQDSLEIMAEVKGVQLVCDFEEEISIYCDRHWLTEALLNIAKNCVEHTQEGGTVRLQAVQDNIATHIHIVDNGEGIAPEHLPYIFQRFYKADSASANSVGIGLAMAKQIILKQNGIVTATSEKGVGTDFYVKLFRVDSM